MIFYRISFFLKSLKSLREYYRQNGFLSCLIAILSKIHRERLSSDAFDKNSKACRYFLPNFQTSFTEEDLKDKTINWIVPMFGKGSGGHLNIFRFVSMLEKRGFKCRIFIVDPPKKISPREAKEKVCEFFFKIDAEFYFDEVPPAKYTVATEWRTAYWLENFHATKHKCYFVQDYEPYFFPVGSDYILAQNTYKMGFIGITAGSWLSKKLHSEFGMDTYPLSFSYDKELYFTEKSVSHRKKRVFFYARPPTARRAFEIGIMVLDELISKYPEVEVILAGWDLSSYKLGPNYRNLGLLRLEELRGVYNSCDVALVLSLTNLSLLPLELMACGVPVVSNRAPCTEWLLNDSICILTECSVEALCSGLLQVIERPDQRKRIKNNGLIFAKNTSWDDEGEKLSNILRVIDDA